MCFFVGNDFLPHVPSLSIREGGIDMLMKAYELSINRMPDYITNAGKINFKSLKIYVDCLKLCEDDIVRELILREDQQKQREFTNKSTQK